jgi:23S rRNA pseudouridine1911/1915/1917 synthase
VNKEFAARVLYEDNHLLLVNKKAGWLSQRDKTGDLSIVEFAKAYLKKKYNKPGDVFVGLVHRLDRPVSGVIMLARTSKALSRLSVALRDKKFQKTYLAIVQGSPDQHKGRLEHWLLKNHKKNSVKAYNKEVKNSKIANLDYSLQKIISGKSLIEVTPLTGRPHQIRVQLASLNTPIVGDLKYGAKKENEDASICLHAAKLVFEHPVKKEKMTVKCRPEGDLWKEFGC